MPRFSIPRLSRFMVATATIALMAGTTGSVLAADAVPQNDLLNATVWSQTSVEAKATMLGIFDLAKMRLDEALAKKDWTAVPDKQGKDYQSLPVAIVTDLDETVLDNNVYEASLVTRNTSYGSKDYDKYVKDEVTGALPGAVDFLKYAASKGVEIFYVSNRKAGQEAATRANMEKLGFPLDPKVDTVLLQNEKPDWGGAKETRIQYVAKNYRVALLMGDNLGDFSDKASGSLAEREAYFESTKAHWGHDWIAFPNPEYGSWESAAFGGDWSKSPDERRKDKIDALTPWTPKN